MREPLDIDNLDIVILETCDCCGDEFPISMMEVNLEGNQLVCSKCANNVLVFES